MMDRRQFLCSIVGMAVVGSVAMAVAPKAASASWRTITIPADYTTATSISAPVINLIQARMERQKAFDDAWVKNECRRIREDLEKEFEIDGGVAQ